MKSIKDEFTYKYTIKKSDFICHLKNVTSDTQAKEYIKSIKEKHKDASHNCSAYIVGPLQKADDDGEPQGTAGLPMLDILKRNELDYTVAVVSRYFGGIKLGAGGLIRAYAKSVGEAIVNTNLLEIHRGNILKISFLYDKTKVMDHKIGTEVISKEYEQLVSYTVHIKNTEIEEFKKHVLNIDHSAQIIEVDDVYITEKYEDSSNE